MVDLLKTFLSREMENKIDEYLFKMKSTNFLSELNLDLNSKYISLKSYNLHDLELLKFIWLEIANLSVNLYVEYEFFRQFSFPNRFESKIYEKSLKKLGYKQYNGMWKIDTIPNRQCIIENIFYSYIYIFLWQEKKQELDNEQFMKENAENSLLNLRITGTNNDTINEQFNSENMVHVVEPPIIEMRKSSESKMKSNSSEISHNSKIKFNPSFQWICNVCSYNENNNNNINCQVCMSSKFAKINSCVFESSFEASNENKIDSVKHVENKDKWTCTKCTFNNEITVDSCVICLRPNLNEIGTLDDYELPEETWCCKTCRENNLFECYKCKKCRVPAEFFNKWRCGQCSFYNDKVAKHCGACEIVNPYLVKCNLCDQCLVNKMYDKICKKCIVLSERCTNKETFDYQDNRGAQLETSVERNQRDKINESKVKNIESLTQYVESCYKPPSVYEAKHKMNSRPCKNCKLKVCVNNQYWCTKCEDSQWYCQNEACGGINFQNEYCKTCKAKNGSNFSNCNNFAVMKDDGKEVQMWQCEFCMQFNGGRFKKCRCQNLRYLSCFIKCENCYWTNLKNRDKCYKCHAQI